MLLKLFTGLAVGTNRLAIRIKHPARRLGGSNTIVLIRLAIMPKYWWRLFLWPTLISRIVIAWYMVSPKNPNKI